MIKIPQVSNCKKIVYHNLHRLEWITIMSYKKVCNLWTLDYHMKVKNSLLRAAIIAIEILTYKIKSRCKAISKQIYKILLAVWMMIQFL